MAKYSTEQNSQMKVEAMITLAEAGEAMTIDQICSANMLLNGVTVQKMARILGELAEQGVIKKEKHKGSTKMFYRCFAQKGADEND